MTVEGHIENGKIVLNQEISLPEGMNVRVEFVSQERVQESTKELQKSFRRYTSA